jgi:alpha-tubulin suppressor-like RCC1 family protein
VGALSACSLKADTTVACWGSNVSGELGSSTNLGSDTGVPAPATVTGLTGVTALAVGGPDGWNGGPNDAFAGHACALLAGGTVTCWGSNLDGELGNTTNFGKYKANPTPKLVSGLTGVTQIDAGGDYSCARLSSGVVDCWGLNWEGELGSATTSKASSPAPLPVQGIGDATSVSAGSHHACALRAGGQVSCWGLDLWGQAGNGSIGSQVGSSIPLSIW